MKNFGIALLVLACCSAGCKSATWEDADLGTDGLPFTDVTFRPLGNFDVEGSEPYKGHDPAAVSARLDLLDSVMDRVDRIREALDSEESWQVRQKRVLEIMRAPDVSSPEAWFVDQIGASIALERLTRPVDEDRGTREEQEATAYFLDVLVARGSPNAPLVADALQAAWDLLSPQERRSLAMTAAQDAAAYLESCGSCGESPSKTPAVERNSEFRLIADGRVRLLQLANSSTRDGTTR